MYRSVVLVMKAILTVVVLPAIKMFTVGREKESLRG